ncbi:MAG: metallophosphoesterase [Acetobacteraceae bacterium]|nr:metallophosphoesterase [Acetobacteraceae bacterium]
MRSPQPTTEEQQALASLIPRIGRVHLHQRLGLERDFEAHVFRRGTHFFHIENWYSIHGVIRTGLRVMGLHARGQRNARKIVLRQHDLALASVPEGFDGLTLLQLSDLHLDRPPGFVTSLIEALQPLTYDLCVLTGDYRSRTFGSFDAALDGLRELRPHLKGTVYAVLGNHDTIRMVPPMEEAGYRLLLNEWVVLRREGDELYLAGVDDPHFYRTDNFHRAGDEIPPHAFSVLLAHTPEAYRHAAHAGFKLMLCGHTHGGQICLPGGLPVLTDADSPRRLARGPWRYHDMVGYTSAGVGTSVVDVRLNCPPEITLHRLRRAATSSAPGART